MPASQFYRRRRVRFSCTGCGACCTGTSEDCVVVEPDEQEAIRAHLGISRAWFRRRYLERIHGRFDGLVSRPSGDCVFLDGEKRCKIYEVRPRQCRTYPFWPEVVNNERAWHREGKRCEGIGEGDFVPIARIERALRTLRGE